MTKSQNTRKALIASLISMLLCVAMLLGSTFAWFTDSVESRKNKIVAGNLDVELEWSYDGVTWNDVEEDTDMFENTLWEPGYTAVRYLRAKNVGDMALKGQLGINVIENIKGTSVLGNEIDLSNILKYSVVTQSEVEDMVLSVTGFGDFDIPFPFPNEYWPIERYTNLTGFSGRELAQYAIADTERLISKAYPSNSAPLGYKEQRDITVLPGEANTSEIFALVVYMPEETENEANYKKGTVQPSITLGITFEATQADVEEDSFGKMHFINPYNPSQSSDDGYDWIPKEVHIVVPEPGSGDDVNIEIGL